MKELYKPELQFGLIPDSIIGECKVKRREVC